MRQFCVRVIEQKGEMSLDAVTSLVRAKFTSEQNLSCGHMRQILQTLIYDGLVRIPGTATQSCLGYQLHASTPNRLPCCLLFGCGNVRSVWLYFRTVHLHCCNSLQIDEHVGEDDEPVFVNLIMKLPSTSPLTSIPCGQCPVMHECAEGNDISPSTCEYMNAWLDF